MPSALVAVVIAVSALTVVAGVVVSVRGLAPGRVVNGLAALTALLTLVQSLVGAVVLLRGDRPAELATAIGYLIGIVFVMPLGLGWSVADRGRYSGYVLAVAAFTVAVMTGRLVMLWQVTGG